MHGIYSKFQSVDQEEQEILNQGLLDWQKKRSCLGGKDLVAWMLNHTKIDDHEISRTHTTERAEELSVYMRTSMRSNRARLDSIEDSYRRHYDIQRTSGKSRKLRSYSMRLPLDADGGSVPFQKVVPQMLPFPPLAPLMDLYSETDSVSNCFPPTPSLSHNSYSETHSQLRGKISKKKFIAILKKAPKHYDIDAIVADLQDPTGQYIELRDIGGYHKRCRTLSRTYTIGQKK